MADLAVRTAIKAGRVHRGLHSCFMWWSSAVEFFDFGLGCVWCQGLCWLDPRDGFLRCARVGFGVRARHLRGAHDAVRGFHLRRAWNTAVPVCSLSNGAHHA